MLTSTERSITLSAEQEYKVTTETNAVVVMYEVVPDTTQVYQGIVNDDDLEILKSNCGTYANCHKEHDYDAVDSVLMKLEKFEVSEIWEGLQHNGWIFILGMVL